MDASRDELYRKFIEVNFIFRSTLLYHLWIWGSKWCKQNVDHRDTPKPTGWNKVNGMTSCRDVCCNISIYTWQLFGRLRSYIVAVQLLRLAQRSLRWYKTEPSGFDPLGIDVSWSTIAQLVERMTVNHDVTGSRPVGGVNRLIAKTQATNRGLAVSLKKKRTR